MKLSKCVCVHKQTKAYILALTNIPIIEIKIQGVKVQWNKVTKVLS